MPGDERAPWMQFGGMYRPVNDLNQSWIPSPVLPTPRSLPWTRPALPPEQAPVNRPDDLGESSGTGGSIRRRKGWGFLNRIRGTDGKPRSVSQPQLPSSSAPAEPPMDERVPLSEWKAYGYYAFPSVNGVPVRNSSPGPESPSGVHVEEVFNSLRGPDGDHPERWIPGIQHSSLPPRPTRWKEPSPQDPLPFPFECQLNPFLEHQLFGPTSLWFDIGQDPSMLCYGTVEATIPISRADRAQPATYPFLTHMFVNAIGDDPIHPFLWPFMVRNPKGIKCEDLYNAIYENFQHYVSNSEYDDWPQVRQVQCTKAYRARISSRANQSPGYEEGIRRVDYLGDNIMFRGLEPNPNMDGWIMFVGRTW